MEGILDRIDEETRIDRTTLFEPYLIRCKRAGRKLVASLYGNIAGSAAILHAE